MKKLSLIAILLSANVFAAELNLVGGESAIIQANVKTTVTCGGDSSNSCVSKINGLKTLVEACKSNYSASYCIEKYWPTFKTNSPDCVTEAMGVCIDYCKTSYSPAYCADKCSGTGMRAL